MVEKQANWRSAGGKTFLIKINYPNPRHPSISNEDLAKMKKVIEITDNAKKRVIRGIDIVKK